MLPVSLYDTILFTPRADDRLLLDCRWAAGLHLALATHWATCPRQNNLVYRALLKLQHATSTTGMQRSPHCEADSIAVGLGGRFERCRRRSAGRQLGLGFALASPRPCGNCQSARQRCPFFSLPWCGDLPWTWRTYRIASVWHRCGWWWFVRRGTFHARSLRGLPCAGGACVGRSVVRGAARGDVVGAGG